jgi:hypothetical protein
VLGNMVRVTADSNSGKNRTGNPAGNGPASHCAMVTSPNSSPVSFCRLSKKARLSILRMPPSQMAGVSA